MARSDICHAEFFCANNSLASDAGAGDDLLQAARLRIKRAGQALGPVTVHDLPMLVEMQQSQDMSYDMLPARLAIETDAIIQVFMANEPGSPDQDAPQLIGMMCSQRTISRCLNFSDPMEVLLPLSQHRYPAPKVFTRSGLTSWDNNMALSESTGMKVKHEGSPGCPHALRTRLLKFGLPPKTDFHQLARPERGQAPRASKTSYTI